MHWKCSEDDVGIVKLLFKTCLVVNQANRSRDSMNNLGDRRAGHPLKEQGKTYSGSGKKLWTPREKTNDAI